MTYEEARKFLKNVITYPLKPDGENKYPNYWRAKFIDVLNLLDEQAEVLRILGKFGYYACESYEDGERKFYLHILEQDKFVTLELTEEGFETIAKWLEEEEK